jgi:hypothetical protein
LQRFDTVNRLAQLRRRQFLLLRCLIGKKADQIAILMGEMGGSYGLAAAENELCGARASGNPSAVSRSMARAEIACSSGSRTFATET